MALFYLGVNEPAKWSFEALWLKTEWQMVMLCREIIPPAVSSGLKGQKWTGTTDYYKSDNAKEAQNKLKIPCGFQCI